MVSTEEGPDPADIEAWRRLVEGGSYKSVSPQAMVAAVQAMGPSGDQRLLNPLMVEIGDRMMRILRRHIGHNYRNQGKDMIEQAYDKLIEAVLKPKSADGSALRTAFVTTVRYRAADAIRRGQLEQERFVELEDDETALTPLPWKATDIESGAYVESVLRNIRDPRKRHAFRLHMKGATRKSIAAALGLSTKTVETWIKEVKEQLKSSIKVDHDA